MISPSMARYRIADLQATKHVIRREALRLRSLEDEAADLQAERTMAYLEPIDKAIRLIAESAGIPIPAEPREMRTLRRPQPVRFEKPKRRYFGRW